MRWGTEYPLRPLCCTVSPALALRLRFRLTGEHGAESGVWVPWRQMPLYDSPTHSWGCVTHAYPQNVADGRLLPLSSPCKGDGLRCAADREQLRQRQPAALGPGASAPTYRSAVKLNGHRGHPPRSGNPTAAASANRSREGLSRYSAGPSEEQRIEAVKAITLPI
jgi:hypothetical protein